MIRGSSRTSESSDRGGRRSVWLSALLLYALAAGGDFAYHLSNLRSENLAIEVSQIPVAFSAAMFWPVDLIAMLLLAQ
jgi:hypothetical protein